MQAKLFWGRKTFLYVNGASKGIGREVAIQFCNNIGKGSAVLLGGRSEASLEPVKKIILRNQRDSNFKVSLFSESMEKPSVAQLNRKISEFLTMNLTKPSEFQHALIVHGAMTHFDLNMRILDLHRVDDLARYFTLNTFAPIVLNSQFMKIFQEGPKMLRTVLNISSDMSLRPYHSMGTLCAATVARDMYMEAMAREHNGVLVLNYNPGFLDVHVKALAKCHTNEVKELRKELAANGNISDCNEAVNKLIAVLGEREFRSGQRIDFRTSL